MTEIELLERIIEIQDAMIFRMRYAQNADYSESVRHRKIYSALREQLENAQAELRNFRYDRETKK